MFRTTTLQALLNAVWSNYSRIQRMRKDEREEALYDLYSTMGDTPDYDISVDDLDKFIRELPKIDEAVDSVSLLHGPVPRKFFLLHGLTSTQTALMETAQQPRGRRRH